MSPLSARKAMATIAGIGAIALLATACSSSSNSGSGSTSAATSAASSAASAPASSAASAPASSAASSAGSSAASSAASSAGSSAASSGGAAVPGDDAVWCDTIKKNWPNISGKTISVYTSIVGTELDGLKKSWTDFKDLHRRHHQRQR